MPGSGVESLLTDGGGIKPAVSDLIEGETLSVGEGAALLTTLDKALRSFDAGNEMAGMNQVLAFINQVNAFVRSGRLTPEEGQSLIDAAQSVVDGILGR